MKGLIVLYSKTGNTLSVGKRLAEASHFELKEVTAMSDDPNNTKPELVEAPSIIGYDHLIFASPVHGFNLSHIMRKYLNQLPDLTGKTVDLFITHFFPYAWMGGTRTLKQMKYIVESKNGIVDTMVSVNWKSKKRELVISNMIKGYDLENKV